MSAIGNLLWFLAGGVFMGLGWWIAGAIAFCTVVGIPWARACFVIGEFAFLPFRREAIRREELTGHEDIGTGALGMLGNVVWFVGLGLWLALGHAVLAVLCAISIIGIPFAVQHLKLAGLAIAPIGKTIVKKEVAIAARRTRVDQLVAQLRHSQMPDRVRWPPSGGPRATAGVTEAPGAKAGNDCEIVSNKRARLVRG